MGDLTKGVYRVEGWGAGIAWHVLGYQTRTEDDDEIEDRDWVRAVMVGDDSVHLIETDELIEIDREDFCPECGQIGCKAYG